MDFVTGLLLLNGYNAIIVIVDRLTKIRYFIPTITAIIVYDVVNIYVDYVYRLYELLDTIVSNRGL